MGRASTVRIRPASSGEPDGLPREPTRGEQQPEHHEEPDLGQPRHALRERPGRAAVRQLGVAEDQRGHVHRGEPGRVHERRGAVREEGQRQHGDRVQTRGRQRRAPHQPRTAEAGGQAARDAHHELEHHDPDGERDAVLPHRVGGDQRDEDDGGRVVEPRLGLERTGEPLLDRGHPQYREHRRRVRRRGHRTEQHGELPRQAEHVVRADRHHRHRHGHADGGQGEADPHRGPEVAPRGGQTALGQDDRQRREAQCLGDGRVLELDADELLAEHHAHQQVDQQAGQARPRGDPHGEDRQDRDGRTHQQEQVELVDVEGHESPLSGRLVRESSDASPHRRAPRPAVRTRRTTG